MATRLLGYFALGGHPRRSFGWGNGRGRAASPASSCYGRSYRDQICRSPRQTITVAVREQMEPGWHTYWDNPAISVSRLTSSGSYKTASQRGLFYGPSLMRSSVGPLVEYGYDGRVLLLTTVQVPENATKTI